MIAQLHKRYVFNQQKDTLFQSGFGKIYKATEKKTGKTVWLKVYMGVWMRYWDIRPHLSKLKQLEHPFLLDIEKNYVFHSSKLPESAFPVAVAVVMRQVDKINLVQWLKTKPSTAELTSFFLKLNEVMAYLVEKGVIVDELLFKDIWIAEKGGVVYPQIDLVSINNLPLQARWSSEDTQKKESATLPIPKLTSLATRPPEVFMPHEYGEAGKITTAANFWAMGVIMYKCLTGNYPFGDLQSGKNLKSLIYDIIHLPMPENISSVPEPFRTIIVRCLIKNSEERTIDAEMIQEGLEGKSIFDEFPEIPLEQPIQSNADPQLASFIAEYEKMLDDGSIEPVDLSPDVAEEQKAPNIAKESTEEVALKPVLDMIDVVTEMNEDQVETIVSIMEDTPLMDEQNNTHFTKPKQETPKKTKQTKQTYRTKRQTKNKASQKSIGQWLSEKLGQRSSDLLLISLFACVLLLSFLVLLLLQDKRKPASLNGNNLVDRQGNFEQRMVEAELKNAVIFVKGGVFERGQTDPDIGCKDCSQDEQPVRNVRVSDFYMDKYEVTNLQFATFLNAYGGDRIKTGIDSGQIMVWPHEWGIQKTDKGTWVPQKGYENHPIVMVSWYGARAYALFYGKRLPTEAEWEYAAKGGISGKGFPFSGGASPDQLAWYYNNTKQTEMVGQLQANELGLFDMSGNVLEWCSDWYDPKFYEKSSVVNPQQLGGKDKKVIRGGYWNGKVIDLRTTARKKFSPNQANYLIGFRCVKDG